MLKRGTFNLILKSNTGKTEYHFDPINADAELTYRKLRDILGSGPVLHAPDLSTLVRQTQRPDVFQDLTTINCSYSCLFIC
jgi:hypothetical protein